MNWSNHLMRTTQMYTRSPSHLGPASTSYNRLSNDAHDLRDPPGLFNHQKWAYKRSMQLIESTQTCDEKWIGGLWRGSSTGQHASECHPVILVPLNVPLGEALSFVLSQADHLANLGTA
eukprot:3410337-Amphidinium_carterae.1